MCARQNMTPENVNELAATMMERSSSVSPQMRAISDDSRALLDMMCKVLEKPLDGERCAVTLDWVRDAVLMYRQSLRVFNSTPTELEALLQQTEVQIVRDQARRLALPGSTTGSVPPPADLALEPRTAPEAM